MKDYDCLDRLLERCPTPCARDINTSHYPCNYDCTRFYPAVQEYGNILTYNKELKDKIMRELLGDRNCL